LGHAAAGAARPREVRRFRVDPVLREADAVGLRDSFMYCRGRVQSIGTVSSEGGPLLLADARVIPAWEVPPDGVPTGELSMGGTALMVALRPGRYACIHDEVEAAPAEGRRCHLRWVGRRAG
jgi:hypothetical protein